MDKKWSKLSDKITEFMKAKFANEVRVSYDKGYATCTIHVRNGRGIGSLISFANLKWISDKLGTEEINIENEYHQDGCDTCDYGSYNEADIVCLNINPFA